MRYIQNTHPTLLNRDKIELLREAPSTKTYDNSPFSSVIFNSCTFQTKLMKTSELIRPKTSVSSTVCTLAALLVLVFELFPKDAPFLLLGSGLVSDNDGGLCDFPRDR